MDGILRFPTLLILFLCCWIDQLTAPFPISHELSFFIRHELNFGPILRWRNKQEKKGKTLGILHINKKALLGFVVQQQTQDLINWLRVDEERNILIASHGSYDMLFLRMQFGKVKKLSAAAVAFMIPGRNLVMWWQYYILIANARTMEQPGNAYSSLKTFSETLLIATVAVGPLGDAVPRCEFSNKMFVFGDPGWPPSARACTSRSLPETLEIVTNQHRDLDSTIPLQWKTF